MSLWVLNNFKYAIILGVVLVIIGSIMAFRGDSKIGYVVIVGGVAFILWTMKLWGLY